MPTQQPMEAELTSHDMRRYASRFTPEPIAAVERLTDGSINETFVVHTEGGERFILQRMSPLFRPAVMDNLTKIMPVVEAAGVAIPHGIRTSDGDWYVVNGGSEWYRALTYIPGVTIHRDITVAGAKSAAHLVGKFHSALADCQAALVEAIPHFHDTHYYFERMRAVSVASVDERKRETLLPIVEEITVRAAGLQTDARDLPQRIIHGDLKISNVRFSETGEAVALIDMDTLMRGSIVTEMGDALRSWCGTAGEDDPHQVFDEEICKVAIDSYASAVEGITAEEIEAIPEGIRILTLELAARFVTDAFEETYFAKSSRYPTLYDQTKTRAENQLAFLNAFEAKRHLL